MTGNTGLSSVLVINGKTLCKRKRRNIVFVIVSTEENSFETITEDMKYKDSFHRLLLKKRDFRCKNISNCCRNALTLFDCLFFFSLLLMYTECQGHEPSSKNRQSRWNFLYNLSARLSINARLFSWNLKYAPGHFFKGTRYTLACNERRLAKSVTNDIQSKL